MKDVHMRKKLLENVYKSGNCVRYVQHFNIK